MARMHEGRYRIHTMDLTLFPHKQWILLLLDRGILGHLSLTESSKNLAGGECYLFLCSLNLSIIDFLVFLAFGVLGIKNYLVFRPIGRLNNIIKSLLYCSFKKKLKHYRDEALWHGGCLFLQFKLSSTLFSVLLGKFILLTQQFTRLFTFSGDYVLVLWWHEDLYF